jgi:hypothetical protein
MSFKGTGAALRGARFKECDEVSKDLTGHGRKLMTPPYRALLAVGLALFAACARTPAPSGRSVTATPSLQQAQTVTPAPPDSGGVPADTTRPATLEEVRGAVARVYKGAVAVEAGGPTPFVVGDFNGDGSEDLAVVVRPGAGKIAEVNSEYAGWIVEDPRKVAAPEVRGDVKVLAKKPEPVAVRQGELLLAVIHGYREKGWRDPLASQTFLLKGAAGSEMKAQPAADALGAAPDKARLPQPQGDVICGRLAGGDGFVYWTGAKYAWSRPISH